MPTDDDRCWCGVPNPAFATVSDGLDIGCDGSGIRQCWCGGDMCVCHNHGEVPCDGCEDCGYDEDEYGSHYDAD